MISVYIVSELYSIPSDSASTDYFDNYRESFAIAATSTFQGEMALHEEIKRQRLNDTEFDATEDAYSCLSCLLEARTEFLYHGVQLMSDSFFNYLLNSVNDTTPDQYAQVMGKVVVPVQVDCENCREEIEVKAGITATPVWDEQANESESEDLSKTTDCVRINHFQNIKVVDILSPDTQQDLSLRKCFYNESTDDEPDWSCRSESFLNCNQGISGSTVSQKTLIVLSKSQCKDKFSYITYDVVEKKLLRLVFQISETRFSILTSESLDVGERYKLSMLRHPKYQKTAPAPTLYPHRNDDLLVNKDVRHLPYPEPVDLFELLEPHSKSSMKKVFSPGHIYDRKYIWVNRNCPSVGVLHCKDFNVQLYTDINDVKKIKIYLEECWDLPITGLGCDKAKDKGRDVLLVLSLSSSWDNGGLYKPARCYITCEAIITKQVK